MSHFSELMPFDWQLLAITHGACVFVGLVWGVRRSKGLLRKRLERAGSVMGRDL